MTARRSPLFVLLLLTGACTTTNTPLRKASGEGAASIVVSLLHQTPKPSPQDMGLSLIDASGNGSIAAMQALLDAGADPNYPDYSTGWCPLAKAAAKNQIDAARLLLRRGADPKGLAEFLDQYHQPGGVLLRQLAAEGRPAHVAAQAPVQRPPVQAATVASDADAPSYRLPEDPDKFAVVVGVEKYSSLPDAQYAEHDAQAVRDHLLALGYPPRNVRLLLGVKATNGAVSEKLNAWLPRNVKETSTVFFYYSGHGAPDPKTGQAYLVPWDGDPQSLEDTAYPLKRLYEKLGALKARRVIVALDSCFSGAGGRSVLPKGTRPLVNKVDVGAPAADNIVALSASAADEISGTMEEQGHGAFTYYFLKGLNGAALDSSGRVTAKSLHDFIVPKVRDAASREDRDQTPQLTGSQNGLVIR